MKYFPKAKSENIVVQNLNNEVLIYDLRINKAFCLNETSALVWQACDGNRSIAEISELMSETLNSPANEELIWLTLDKLKKENLIESGDEISHHFGGISRREVIRKVGLGTMAALPVISSIVAPTATLAQSACFALGQGCSSSPTCCSGCCSSATGGACINSMTIADGQPCASPCGCISGVCGGSPATCAPTGGGGGCPPGGCIPEV